MPQPCALRCAVVWYLGQTDDENRMVVFPKKKIMNPESRGVDVWLLRSADGLPSRSCFIAISPIARGG